jgi:nucleoside-diphosphate-sugar epimerase
LDLFVFGLGYSARHFASTLGADVRVAGTVRTLEKAASLARAGIETFVFDSAGDADPAIEARLGAADAVVVSAPPGEDGDPALQRFAATLASSRGLRKIVYLSTIGVYGDHGGAWIDESAPVRMFSERAKARVAAENAWTAIAQATAASLDVLRLAGIYGPGRNMLIKMREGAARRIIKHDQVFNRIHVDDIAHAVRLALVRSGGGVWNVTDNEPAPPQDVTAFAANLLGLPPPPEEDFETAAMTPMARSFYTDNKRVSNAKLKRELGFAPLYPTYREGLRALASAEEGTRI